MPVPITRCLDGAYINFRENEQLLNPPPIVRSPYPQRLIRLLLHFRPWRQLVRQVLLREDTRTHLQLHCTFLSMETIPPGPQAAS